MGKLIHKSARETITFEVEGSFELLQELLKKLKSGDSFNFEIDECSDVPTRFVPSLDANVKNEEAWISLSCAKDKYLDFIKYLENF